MSAARPALPRVTLTSAQALELVAAWVSAGGVGELPTFSCNSGGQLWPSPTWGLSQPRQRRLVHSPGAQALARAVLSAKDAGGRFRLAFGRVLDADTGTTLVLLDQG